MVLPGTTTTPAFEPLKEDRVRVYADGATWVIAGIVTTVTEPSLVLV